MYGLIHVKVAKEGHLLVTHAGETYPFYEVERGVFKTTRTERTPDAYGTFTTIVFNEDAKGNLLLIPDGPMTYTKAPWYATSGFTIISLGVAVIFVIGTLLSWALLGLIRLIRKKRIKDKTQKVAKWLGVIYGLLIVFLFGSLISDGEVDPVYQLPKEAYGMGPENTVLLDLFPFVFSLVTIGLLVTTVFLWVKRSDRLLSRLHYTIYTGTACYFVWLFYYWDLF